MPFLINPYISFPVIGGCSGDVISTTNLAAYYKFDNNVNDSSVNALNGTATDITYSAGKYDNAANLNGTTSFVSVADNALLEGSSGNISVFGWIKITDYASDTAQHLASKWATTTGWRLVARPGDILITLGSTNIGRGTGVPTGDWVHIGFTYNGSTCKVYQNGVQVGTDASATATLANTQQMHIGKRSNGSDGFVKGQLDDVNVWQRVLTATEVSNLYNSSCPLKSKTSFTGGTATIDGIYTYRTFTSTDTLYVAGDNISIDYIIVAGGGGGGVNGNPTYYAGGGGGAGGVLTGSTTLTAGTHTITIGAGGTKALNNTQRGATGGTSSFYGLTALGGGGGSGGGNITPGRGGSGGAAGADDVQRFGAAGTTGQGFAGGNNNPTSPYASGGGGGAGEAGSNPPSTTKSGDGGDGITWLNGSAYGGGGGGSNFLPTTNSGGAGGAGGGGAGATNGGAGAGSNGSVNTGGGAGNYADGGSGIVIIRYVTP
jgi:hypothetical protein